MFSSGVTRFSHSGAVSLESPTASSTAQAAAAATLNWICMTECRRADLPLPQHPLRSAISVTTTLSYPFPINFSTIPYYPLCSTRILTALSHTVETSSKQPWSVQYICHFVEKSWGRCFRWCEVSHFLGYFMKTRLTAGRDVFLSVCLDLSVWKRSWYSRATGNKFIYFICITRPVSLLYLNQQDVTSFVGYPWIIHNFWRLFYGLFFELSQAGTRFDVVKW